MRSYYCAFDLYSISSSILLPLDTFFPFVSLVKLMISFVHHLAHTDKWLQSLATPATV